jgi:hypothetical protein
MKTLTFPKKVGVHKRVTIYQATKRKAGHEYVNYTVSFCRKGKQEQRSFSDLKKAEAHAAECARVGQRRNGREQSQRPRGRRLCAGA